MKVYEARYCPCIHESAYSTISTHRTEKGARSALAKYVNERRNEDNEMNAFRIQENIEGRFSPLDNERWQVVQTELQE